VPTTAIFPRNPWDPCKNIQNEREAVKSPSIRFQYHKSRQKMPTGIDAQKSRLMGQQHRYKYGDRDRPVSMTNQPASRSGFIKATKSNQGRCRMARPGGQIVSGKRWNVMISGKNQAHPRQKNTGRCFDRVKAVREGTGRVTGCGPTQTGSPIPKKAPGRTTDRSIREVNHPKECPTLHDRGRKVGQKRGWNVDHRTDRKRF